MDYVISFLVAVGAQTLSYFLCKWLDRILKEHSNDKHDNQHKREPAGGGSSAGFDLHVSMECNLVGFH